MFKNVLKVLFSNALLSVLGIVNSFVYPILLSVEDYAYYQQYMLYLGYINICHLGIASGMFLNYAGKDYRKIDKGQYKSEVHLIFIVLTIFTVIGFITSGIAKSWIIFYVALSIIPHCLIASFQAIYQAWERFTEYAIINALPKFLFTISIIGMYFGFKKVNGDAVVLSYILIIYVISLYFIIDYFRLTRREKTKTLLSDENIKTTFNGFLITLGNYVNLLFHSIDKQFVHIFYSVTSFAIYSFAMSLQNIMMIFITALSNPFYPRLARGDLSNDELNKMKELLLMFGAYSGCAYYAVSFVVKHFITKYTSSLEVVSMFFAVFPAMAIINVLYINLYKIKKILKKYILTLLGMLMVACILNGASVLLHGDYIGISLATMVTYYIWLFYSQRDFVEITIEKKDYIYLVGFFLLYFTLKAINHDIIGFILYGVLITIWNVLIYHKSIEFIWDKYLKQLICRKI